MEKEKSNNYKIGETQKGENNNALKEKKMVHQEASLEREIDKTKDEKEIAKQEESKKSPLG